MFADLCLPAREQILYLESAMFPVHIPPKILLGLHDDLWTFLLLASEASSRQTEHCKMI